MTLEKTRQIVESYTFKELAKAYDLKYGTLKKMISGALPLTGRYKKALEQFIKNNKKMR